MITLSACVRDTVVILRVCLSITMPAATYLFYTSQVRCYEVSYGISNVCRAWISLKMLHSKVLASFVDHNHLSRFLMSSPWGEEIAMAFFNKTSE